MKQGIKEIGSKGMEKHILKESWYSRVLVRKINLKGKNNY